MRAEGVLRRRRPAAGSLAAAGFTLVECLVAVAVVGWALVMAAGFLSAQAVAAERLATRQSLLAAAETVLEMVRAGELPLRSQQLWGSELPSSRVGVQADVVVEPQVTPGLYRVVVRTACTARGESLSLELESMVWRP